MASFVPKFSLTESADGTLVTVTQQSFDISNDQGYVKSNFTTNKIVVKDVYGNTLATLDFVNDSDNVRTFTKTKDYLLIASLTLAGIASYSLTWEYPTHRITATKLNEAILNGHCCNTKSNSHLSNISLFINGYMSDRFLAGKQVSYQQNIDNANTYLDLLV
jgi:hypothetical protein